jgi:hypothetical protein
MPALGAGIYENLLAMYGRDKPGHDAVVVAVQNCVYRSRR